MASRLAFGFVMDRIGGVATLVLGSALQAVALAFFLPFDGLVSLYVVSGVFGLFQGGIVPSYAMIVREHFPAREAGTRVGLALAATLAGMALGGWMSGAIFDATGLLPGRHPQRPGVERAEPADRGLAAASRAAAAPARAGRVGLSRGAALPLAPAACHAR